jgi:hypothetical protein
MRDVIVLAIIAVFFALCVAYVHWCDRIIGPDPDDLRDDDDLAVMAPIENGEVVDPAVLAGATAVTPRAPGTEVTHS